MKLAADLHCHTVASHHAFSTVLEIAQYASQQQMEAVAITDHGPDMIDGVHFWHFWNQKILPDRLYGVRVLRGIEANILSRHGELDTKVPDYVYPTLDWVVASIHSEAFRWDPDQVYDEVTQAYLNVLDHPQVDCIGHPGNGEFPYDLEKVLRKVKEHDRVIELNNTSYLRRSGARENYRATALLCKQLGVQVAVDSDAHFAYCVGHAEEIIAMLEEIDFPRELIVNATAKNLYRYLEKRKKRLSDCGASGA